VNIEYSAIDPLLGWFGASFCFMLLKLLTNRMISESLGDLPAVGMKDGGGLLIIPPAARIFFDWLLEGCGGGGGGGGRERERERER